MKFCSKCGAQMPDAANVCSNCGTPLMGAPMMYQQAPKKPLNETADGAVEKFAKFLGVIGFAFLIAGGIAFLYNFIMAIVSAVGDSGTIMGVRYSTGGGFSAFVAGVASAFDAVIEYGFYAVVTFIGSKLLKK